MRDYSQFKTYSRKWYLHDLCLKDPRIAHNARFVVTESSIPSATLRFGPGSHRAVVTTKNYLSEVWRELGRLVKDFPLHFGE